MNRRDFLKSIVKVAAVTAIATKLPKTICAQNSKSISSPDLVGVRDGTPVEMFRKGIMLLAEYKLSLNQGRKLV
ncbi:MAG: hypothetical protein LBG23_01580 [Endomicrobium sp.]|jgi:hypothetical protein|nr:hypothetical protein [Endomicrobium sp.]